MMRIKEGKVNDLTQCLVYDSYSMNIASFPKSHVITTLLVYLETVALPCLHILFLVTLKKLTETIYLIIIIVNIYIIFTEY